MKFCKLITEVDLELLEWLLNNGYPIDRIEENGQVYYKTPAMLCQNMKVNDEVTNYSNGLIHMDIENVRRKRGLYKTGDLLIDMDSNIIQKGLEKIMVSKAAFTIITTLMDVPHKTVSRNALVFYLEQAYHHEILDNTLTVHIATIRRLLGDEYISFHNSSVHQYTIKVHKKINNLKSRKFEDYFMRNHY